jgi:hypothetical protein
MRLALVVAFVLATFLTAPAHGASLPHAFTLPFTFVDNRAFVEVTLNGRGPFHLILDTGGTAVLSDSAARRLGLKVKDAGEGSGVGATTQHFGQTKVASVRVGDLQLSEVEFSVTSFDDSPQVFGRQRVDGVIGSEIFESMVVKHDYVQRILTFTPPDEYRYTGPGTVLTFKRPRQIPVIQATLDGVPGAFGVDTGARSAMLLYGPYCEQNHLAAKYGAKLQGVTGWGIGGPVRSLLARAHVLDLGGVSVHDLVVRLSTQKSGLTTATDMAGLIGPDVLSQFDVTFDYARSRIILEKNANYGRRDAYDRAGVWMGQKGSTFSVVDVIAGGPADEAGVRAGDTILAIDGRSTGTLNLPEVREQMRRRPIGDKVTLVLESQGQQRTVVVTLRDLA